MRPHLATPQQRRIVLGDARRVLLELGLHMRYGVLEVLLSVGS